MCLRCLGIVCFTPRLGATPARRTLVTGEALKLWPVVRGFLVHRQANHPRLGQGWAHEADHQIPLRAWPLQFWPNILEPQVEQDLVEVA